MPWQRYHMTNLIELMEGFILSLKHSLVKMSVIIDIFIALLRSMLSASATDAAYNKVLMYLCTLVIHCTSGYIRGFMVKC